MAATPDYEPSALDWVREQVERILQTGTTDGITVKDRPIVLLTYRGATSGKLRKTPVMRVEHDGRYALVASQGGAPKHPTWYHNVVAEPHVELQDGTETADYQRRTDREIPVFLAEPV